MVFRASFREESSEKRQKNFSVGKSHQEKEIS
jgi:hypothetical protein